jgi:predicted extracellular nuclease
MSRSSRALLATLAASLALAAPANADLVINEIDYDQPGTDTAEFLEIRNNGATAVDLDPYALRFVSGADLDEYLTVDLPAANLASGGYFVVCGDPANVTGCDHDAGAATNLIQNGAPDAVALQTGGTIVDTVSYEGVTTGLTEGTTGAPADTAAGAPAPPESISRVPDGCDTDDNAADFDRLTSTPDASNGGTACGGPPADAAPSVAATTPANNAADVPLDGNLEVEFSEPVTLTNAFTLSCVTSGAHDVTATDGPTEFRLDPAGTFERGERCTLTVLAGGVSDNDANDPPDTMTGNTTVSFLTVGVEGLRIRDIQGTQHVSPRLNQVVSRVPGVVTARRNNGFFFQDSQPDADVNTSEGLFVFTQSAPAAGITVGSAVLVSGLVTEFRGAANALGLTQISQPTVTVTGPGAAIPATLIGTGGRVPPGRIIDNDSLGDVDLNWLFDPDEDGIDFYESMEGMKVTVADPFVLGPTASFGEIPVVADGGAFAGPRTARGGVIVTPDDFNPERMHLDDEVLRTQGQFMPAANVRDSLSSVEAVIDYSFGNFKLQVLVPPTVTSGGLEKESTEAPNADELSVGSFNVENLTVGNASSKFAALADTLVNRMKAPDIVAVEEIQDDNGTTNDGNVVADQTWARLIAAIRATNNDTGPLYDFRQIDPVNNQDGGAPGGNIRVGFLFRTGRGLEFVDRGEAGPTDAVEVVETKHGARLNLSPARIAPADAAWTASRKPLVGEFLWRGRKVFAVANHFASKGGDDPLFGHFQPPVRHTENGLDGRHQQAARVNEFVRELIAADRQANVIVMGDINDFEFSRTVDILESGGALFSLMKTLPENERYSYVFEGNSQTLDQILVSKTLMSPRPEYDSVHMNAEFADQTSDHDPQVARIKVVGEPAKD